MPRQICGADSPEMEMLAEASRPGTRAGLGADRGDRRGLGSKGSAIAARRRCEDDAAAPGATRASAEASVVHPRSGLAGLRQESDPPPQRPPAGAGGWHRRVTSAVPAPCQRTIPASRIGAGGYHGLAAPAPTGDPAARPAARRGAGRSKSCADAEATRLHAVARVAAKGMRASASARSWHAPFDPERRLARGQRRTLCASLGAGKQRDNVDAEGLNPSALHGRSPRSRDRRLGQQLRGPAARQRDRMGRSIAIRPRGQGGAPSRGSRLLPAASPQSSRRN